MKKKLSIKSGSSHFKNAALMFLFSIIGMTSYSQSLTFDLTNGADFSFLSTNRTLLSGTQNAAGSVYKYSNLVTIGTTTIYGKLTIIATLDATIVNFDDDTSNASLFQPIISTTASGHVEYKLEFFDTATNFPVYIEQYFFNGMNLDGNATSQEKILLRRNDYSTNTISVGSELSISDPGNGERLFKGKPDALGAVPDFEVKARFFAYYQAAKTSINFKVGATGTLSNRKVAIAIGKKIAFGSPQNPVSANLNNEKVNMTLQSHSVDEAIAPLNTNVVFKIVIINTGTASEDATNVIVGAKLPAGYTFQSYTASPNSTYDEVTGIWSLAGSLPRGNALTLNITAKVNATGPYEFMSYVSSSIKDTDASNNSGSVTVTPQLPFDQNSSTMYLSQYQSSNTKLYELDNNKITGLTIEQIGTSYNGEINAIGYNPLDNYIYGLRLTNHHLCRIGKDNVTTDLGGISPFPNAGQGGTFFAGDIDEYGNYYLIRGGSLLYKVNLTTKTVTTKSLTQSVSTYDITYNKKDKLLYCVNLDNNQKLLTIDPISGTVSVIGLTVVNDPFGAMFSDGITGAIYGNSNGVGQNTPGFYEFNTPGNVNSDPTIAFGTAIKRSTSIATIGNDGAHNVNEGIPLLVDLKITKSNNQTTYIPGTTSSYTLTISNSGPNSATDALVGDLVPDGIPTDNMSWTYIYPGGGAILEYGALSLPINLNKNESVTVTVDILIPLNFTGNLVNTATVTKGANSNENNLSNNSATDTDTKCPAATITTQPLVTQTVTKNDPTTQLSVVASGTSVTYQWYKNTSNSTTGGTIVASATSASYTPLSTVVGQTYYYVQVISPCGSLFSTTSLVKVNEIICYKNPVTDNTSGTIYDTRIGISALNRTGVASTWPGVRKSGWMVLEAKTKGFVLNRVKFNASSQPVADDGTTLVITNPIEGMMVFDTTNNCLKVYTTTNGINFAWYCMETQTCPE